MAETLPGWEAPVHGGMTDTPMAKGVPLLFFAGNMLGSLFLALCLVQIEPVWSVLALLGGGVLYVLVRIGTAIEPRLAGILSEWWSYSRRYEG